MPKKSDDDVTRRSKSPETAMSSSLKIRRAYESRGRADGFRVLVDRLWPRGITKDDLALDAWERDLAPSDELRRWFAHDPSHWSEFRIRYRQELREVTSASAVLDELALKSVAETVTLIYGARDKEHNHAIVLQKEIARRAKPATRGHGSRTKGGH